MLKSTNSIFKSAALLFAICFAGGAWAAVKPKAVWNEDFASANLSRNGISISIKDNGVADGIITIKSSDDEATGGILLSKDSGNTTKFTFVAGLSNVTMPGSGIQRLFSSKCGDTNDRTGIAVLTTGQTTGYWATSEANGQAGDGSTIQARENYTITDGSLHYLGGWYAPSGGGTKAWINGNLIYHHPGLKGGNDKVTGLSLGGKCADAAQQLEGAKVHFIAAFDSTSVTDDDVAYWSLTGMTAAETVADGEAITGGSNVGVNLSTADMTATVSGATTAAALFVQENATLEVSGALTIGGGTGPLYVADTKTLTIDASDYDVSAMEDGDSIKIIGATLFGTVTLVAPADSSRYTYHLTAISGEGVYLYARYKALNSININFYMDRDSGYPADTAASKLTTSDPVGISGYQVPGNQWTEMAGKNGSLALTALDGTDAGTATISGAYQQGWYNTSFTANSDVRYGYIDDNASVTTPTITISGVPFAAYKVVIYHSYSSASLGYDSIDGVNLYYAEGALSLGTSSWGQPNLIALVEGKNVLVSGVFSASTLTIKANRLSGTARANIAAIQIIQVDAPSEASTSVDVTAPSEDWSAVPTAAKTRTVCAGAVSFGNNSDYDATVGGRAATVVDIEDGYYGEINGLLKSGESYSRGERDTYLIMSGGAARLVKGRQPAPYGDAVPKTTTGNALVQLGGSAVAEYVFGAGDQGAGNATLTGNAGVVITGNATVNGAIVGGWGSSHQNTPKVTGNTAVRIENVQNTNTAAAQFEGYNICTPNNFIIGGPALQWNVNGHSKVQGSSSVTVDIPAGKSGTFSKRIIGGGCADNSTSSDFHGTETVEGNSSVTITAPSTVSFTENIIGGGYANKHASCSAPVGQNSSVTLNGGTYTGKIVAGGEVGTAGSANVAGTATLTINGGVFSGATLAAGNASQTKKLVANTVIDTSTMTVTGFDALDVGAGVTQTAIAQSSGEFSEITVHDGAQYTAATSGTAALRVVSSTDGGTKGVVVFDGLSTSYTGDITIAANSKAKLVSGTYTGTFTVESGATLEIDPGAAYTCAASFTGAGSVVVKSGPVTFTGTNTLTNGMTVDSGATMIAEVTGNEGYINISSGGTLKLYVTTDQYRYEGNVFKGTNSGTLEYWHGIEADFSDYVKVTDANSFNGNNLLPYYQIWKVVGEAMSGTVNTAANWPGANAVPTVRADETYGNAAFYVEDDATVTVNIDATMNFKEIQVYGSGTVIFKGDGTNYLAANYLYMTSGVNVEISGGDALRLSNGEIVAASSSQTITVNSGAKLTLNNISCDNKIVVGGTLETSGETTLSAANTSAQGSLIRVLSGETLLSTLLKGIKGNIRIDDDAVLRMVDSLGGGGAPQYYDNIDPDGTTQLDIYGTLDFKNNGFEAGEDITINLYDGAEITAWSTGNSATYGDMAWLESGKVTVTGRVTLNTTIRTKTGAAVEFDVGADAVLTINKNFVSQSSAQDGGGSLTKSGAGTLKFTQETLTKPLTISAGKVQLKCAFTSGLAISIDSGAELELGVEQGDSDVTSISFANITGTGTIRYSSTSTGYYTMPSSAANMFATTLHVANDNTAGGVVIAWNNGVTTNRTMSGSGKYRSDWGGTKDTPSRYLLALQDDNSEWSGVFHQNDRLHGLKVAGVDGAANKTLTLSGTQDQTNTLEIESSGSAKLTGTWIGDTTVDGEFGGTGSLTGDLTFNAGSTFKVWETGSLTVSGALTLPGSGKVNVDVSAISLSKDGTTIMTFDSVSGNTAAFSCEYATFAIDGNALKAYPAVASVTTTSGVTHYLTVGLATSAAANAGESLLYITICGSGTVNVPYFAKEMKIRNYGGATINIRNPPGDVVVSAPVEEDGFVTYTASDVPSSYKWTNSAQGNSNWTVKENWSVAAAINTASRYPQEGDTVIFDSAVTTADNSTVEISPDVSGTVLKKIEIGLNVTFQRSGDSGTVIINSEDGIVLTNADKTFTVGPNITLGTAVTTDVANKVVKSETDNGAIIYSVVDPAAEIVDGDQYGSLANAVEVAEAGDEITLLANASVGSVGKAITLDIDTYELTLTSADALDSITSLKGTGTLVLPAGYAPTSALATLLQSADWQGTLVVAGYDAGSANIPMNTWGNSGSKIELSGVSGGMNGLTVSSELVLDDGSYDYGLDIDYNNGSNQVTIEKLSGSGTFRVSSTAQWKKVFQIKNADNFTGNVVENSNGTACRLYFGYNRTGSFADVTNAKIGGTNGDGGFIAIDGQVKSGVADRVFPIADGASWVAGKYGLILDGSLEVKGSATITGILRPNIVESNAKLIFDDIGSAGAPKFLTISSIASSANNVKVDLTGATLRDAAKLIDWSAASYSSAPSVSFVFADGSNTLVDSGTTYLLSSEADGLYLRKAVAFTFDGTPPVLCYYPSVAAALSAGTNIYLYDAPNETVTLEAGKTININGKDVSNLTVNSALAEYASPIAAENNAYSLANAASAPVTYYWTGATDSSWTTIGNWKVNASDGPAATRAMEATDSVAFTDGAIVALGATRTVAGIEVNGAVTITAKAATYKELKTSGNITGTGTLTFVDVCLSSMASGLTVAPNVNFTDDSELGGEDPFTFNGNVSISDRFPQWGCVSVINGAVSVASGAEIQAAGGGLTIYGTTTLNGAFTKSGSNALTLAGVSIPSTVTPNISAGSITINGAVAIADGATFTIPSSGLTYNSATFTGLGTVSFGAVPTSALTFSSWTGTVVLPSFAANGQNFNNFGVEGSKVKLMGISSGWLGMGTQGSDYTINPEVVLAGNMTLTDSSNRSWIFKKVSGTGNLSLTPGGSNHKITIRINDLASTIGTISNNMGSDTTWTIDKISFPAETELPAGTKLLSTGGNGAITLGSITVGGVALSNVSYSRNTSGADGDGFYVNSAATTDGTGAEAVTTVTTDGSTTSVAVTLDNDYSGKIAVPANVATLTVTGPTITAGQLQLVTTQGTYDNLLSYSEGAVSLNPSAYYQNGEGEANKIYVEPKTAASDPMTMPGATTAPSFNIKTIPGLYYVVRSGTDPSSLTVGSATQATTTTTGLTGLALGNEDTVRYYKISVGRTAAEAAQ